MTQNTSELTSGFEPATTYAITTRHHTFTGTVVHARGTVTVTERNGREFFVPARNVRHIRPVRTV